MNKAQLQCGKPSHCPKKSKRRLFRGVITALTFVGLMAGSSAQHNHGYAAGDQVDSHAEGTVVLQNGVPFYSGRNYYGHSGIPIGPNITSFTPIVDASGQPVSDVISAKIAGRAVLLLKADGSVWMAGRHDFTQSSNSPLTQISVDNIIDIDISGQHIIMLQSDGRVLTMGFNNRGVLGDGNVDNGSTYYATPQYVIGPGEEEHLTNIIDVDCSSFNSFALRADGILFAWGKNSYTECSVASTATDISRPEPVVKASGETLTGVKQVNSGHQMTLALTCDGKLWAWGINGFQNGGSPLYGALGTGLTSINSRARTVRTSAGELTNVMDFCASDGSNNQSAIAVTADGVVYAWGKNSHGQCGTSPSNILNVASPIQMNINNIIGVHIDENHAVLTGVDGRVHWVGQNIYNAGGSAPNPVYNPYHIFDVHGVGNTTRYVDAGAHSSTAVSMLGELYVWGDYLNQANNSYVNSTTPEKYAISNIRAVDGEYDRNTCINGEGKAMAWGHNWNNTLGTANSGYYFPNPETVINLSNVTDIATGEYATMFLTADGKVYMTGSFYLNGNWSSVTTATRIMIGEDIRVREISSGPYHQMVITSDGRVMSWGYNFSGECGVGNSSYNDITVPTYAVDENNEQIEYVKRIAAGYGFSLAVYANGNVHSAGGSNGADGKGGNATEYFSTVRDQESMPLFNIKEAGTNDRTGTAVAANGRVYTWGWNAYGQCAHGYTSPSDIYYATLVEEVENVVAVGNSGFASGHQLIKKADNKVCAVGYNNVGQLGIGNNNNQTTFYCSLTFTNASVKSLVTENIRKGTSDTETHAFPNPFTDEVTLKFELALDAEVTLRAYNAVGQLMDVPRTEARTAGRHTIRLNTSEWAEGVYIVELSYNDGNETQVARQQIVKQR